jgi:hypothetical protein
MEKIDQILDSLYSRVIEPCEAKHQLLDLFAVMHGRGSLKSYTKWLRQNEHLNSAPFPPLIDQYLKSL